MNLAVIGVLCPISWESIINEHFREHPETSYWLPWGNRFQTLKKVCDYLCKNDLWQREDSSYRLYKQAKDSSFELVFFHHDSKKQGGTGLIYYKYYIKKVLISEGEGIAINASKVKHQPLQQESKVWLEISRVSRLGAKGYDFAENFDVHPSFIEMKGRKSKQVDAKKDAAFLYHQVLPVQECFHKDKNCNCLICR